MKTSRAFMTAVPLTLLLVAILAVLLAVTPGAFSFDRWPDAPKSAVTEREVVVDVPVSDGGESYADARRAPAIERQGTVVAVKDPSRPAEPVAAPEPRQVVADAEPVTSVPPAAGGDGATTNPVAEEPARGLVPAPEVPALELPALPAIPAKDLPGTPDPVLPEMDGDMAARPRDLRDDQE